MRIKDKDEDKDEDEVFHQGHELLLLPEHLWPLTVWVVPGGRLVRLRLVRLRLRSRLRLRLMLKVMLMWKLRMSVTS